MVEAVKEMEHNAWGHLSGCPYDTRQVEETTEAFGFKAQEIVYFAHEGKKLIGKITKIGNKALDGNGQYFTVFVVRNLERVYFKTLGEIEKRA